MKKIGLGILLLCFFLQGCRKEESCGVAPRIKILSRVNNSLIESDTVKSFDDFTITAESDEPILGYEWYLDNQLISTDSFFTRGYLAENSIIKLVVKYECGNNTVIKKPYIWPKDEFENGWNGAGGVLIKHYKYPILGRYKGYYTSNPGQEVEIVLQDTFDTNCDFMDIIENLPTQGVSSLSAAQNIVCHMDAISIEAMPFAIYYETAGFGNNPSTAFPPFQGMARLDKQNRNRILVTYTYADLQTGEMKYDEFHGLRM